MNKPAETEQYPKEQESTVKQLISSREIEVMLWVGSGKTNPEIADILGVSVNTIKNHVHNAISKLGVENRSQAAAKTKQMNLLK